MAGREPVRDRKARLERGGEWLREQRTVREWSGVEFARRLGLDQAKLSAYEHGRYEVDVSIARAIAEVLDMSEVAVWRGLGLPLPAELRTDAEAVAWAWRTAPEVMEQITGRKAPAARTERDQRLERVTHEGDRTFRSSPGEESAV